MHAGHIVETGPTRAIFKQPKHPYTRALLASTPRFDTSRPIDSQLRGQAPDIFTLRPDRCRFVDRCPAAMEICMDQGLLGSGFPRTIRCSAISSVMEYLRPEGSEPLAEAFLQVRDLRKEFALHSSMGLRLGRLRGSDGLEREPATLAALDGVSFDVHLGEAVGVVGESGCGKSTLAKCLVKLLQPTDGTIRYDSLDVGNLGHTELKRFRKQVQIVFQDPAASLDPRWKVRQIVAEPLRIHGLEDRGDLQSQLLELLELVGLRADHLERLPNELSGGEQQRVSIARALATRPRFLILDEPTSALDASTRVHILTLLASLRKKLRMTYILISHDLSVIRALCDRVFVMYLGRVVEVGPTGALFELPLHPYTEALIAAIPVPDPDVQKQPVRLRGDLTRAPAAGCSLAPRCPMAAPACTERPQRLVAWGEQRSVACHRISGGEIQPVPVLQRGAVRHRPGHEPEVDINAGILPPAAQTIPDTDV